MSEDEGYVPLIEEKALEEGKMKLVRHEGVPVLFVRRNGKIYVFDDRCPHMGCRFSGGTLDGDMIVCPCHDWRFDLETGNYENNPAYQLVSYPFTVKDDKIWVNLGEDEEEK